MPYQKQLELKRDHFLGLLKDADISLTHPLQMKKTLDRGHRNRLDFTWHQGNLGLYSNPTAERSILDIESCEILLPSLNQELQFLRSLLWNFSKASFRLKVSPQGFFGLWIDAANTEIKEFLDEKKIAQNLLARGWIVEVGQKKKELAFDGKAFRLQEQQLRVWNESKYRDQNIALYSTVSGFAQPSFLGQETLRKSLHELIEENTFENCLEFGSGNGNWSFSLLEHCQKLTACEQDSFALAGLRKSLVYYPQLEPRVQILEGDFHKQKSLGKDFDLAFVNPARSGLRSFAEELKLMPNLSKILYISCFPESFIKDALALKSHFRLEKVHLVDQFPQTHHYELAALFQRIKLEV
jgi:23S rRNA (uracil1939-C5)-methyltransferase